MTVQITVRIADDAAAFLDHEATAADTSRAAVITRALRREARRRRAEADAAIYAAEGENTELAGWQRASEPTVNDPWSELD
ncbi:MAG: antitoxin [Micropruina sp.]